MVHRNRSVSLAAALLVAASPAAAQDLRDVLARTAPDSLAAPLRAVEARSGRPAEAGEAARVLGQLHYARGEYRQAAAAFARAAARLEPSRKGEARYWEGLAWIGAGDASRARAVLEEVARTEAALRAPARLGMAFAWEAQHRPERALEELERLTAEGGGDALAAALERTAAVAGRLRRDDIAARARERLLRERPASAEAARLRAVGPGPASAASAGAGAVAVHIGAFADPARARALAETARRAGFSGAQVVSRTEGGARVHAVRLGAFASPDEARRAGERAARELGVAWRIVTP
jgi:tetratricopeptide (TPR) repeat protein